MFKFLDTFISYIGLKNHEPFKKLFLMVRVKIPMINRG